MQIEYATVWESGGDITIRLTNNLGEELYLSDVMTDEPESDIAGFTVALINFILGELEARTPVCMNPDRGFWGYTFSEQDLPV